MTSNDQTGLEVENHGATLVVRINGGKHALFTPEIAAQLAVLPYQVVDATGGWSSDGGVVPMMVVHV